MPIDTFVTPQMRQQALPQTAPPAKPAAPLKKTMKHMAVRPADMARLYYVAIAPAGHTIEDMMDPEYWVHVARLFKDKPYGQIDVISEDGTLDVTFRVMAASDRWLRVRLIRQAPAMEAIAAAPDLPDGWHVVYRKERLWQVCNGQNKVIADGLESESAAKARMNELAAEMKQ